MNIFAEMSTFFKKLSEKSEKANVYKKAIDKVLDMTPEQAEKLVRGENPF